jgi:hypothetical protein
LKNRQRKPINSPSYCHIITLSTLGERVGVRRTDAPGSSPVSKKRFPIKKLL